MEISMQKVTELNGKDAEEKYLFYLLNEIISQEILF